jgi:hypothetical protein
MKPMFITDLDMRAVPGGYILLAPLKYISMLDGKEKLYEVPAEFHTNLASIPRMFRVMITGHGKDRWAAALHDYLYSIRHPRKEADKIFREALRATGNGRIKSSTMYHAVRAGGWAAYPSEGVSL